jgi:hypothetical protein
LELSDRDATVIDMNVTLAMRMLGFSSRTSGICVRA